jgi:branched-chain amino acid transport system permease protein
MILHTSGVTFLMLTLAIVSVLSEYANQARGLTGGDDGLQGIRLDPIFGVFEFNIFGKTAYVYAAVVLFGWFLFAWRIVHSTFGRSVDGIRQNPRRMRAIGTPVWRRLLAIYTISAAMAGSAGALSAHATRFVGLSVLDLLTSGIVTVALILGGTRRLYGAFVGATTYFVVQDWSAKISPFFWEFVVGGMLIVTVLLLDGGLLDLGPAALRLRDRWRAGREGK